MSATQTAARTGSCLCNKIHFEMTGEPFMSALCHCSNCKKSTGASFGPYVLFKNDQIKIVDEEKQLRVYDGSKTGSGQKVNRQFCGNCGSPLFLISDKFGKDVLMVLSGTVDDTKGWEPKREIFCDRRLEWLPKFDTERV